MHSTEQETFWEGDFGNEYTDRNRGLDLAAANLAFWGKVLRSASGISRVMEFGSNIGMNLSAIRLLLPHADLSAVEINKKAAFELKKNIPLVDLHQTSILDFTPGDRTWDLVFTKGVLIHINPDKLPEVYDRIYNSSSRYILVSEYYNPKPVEIDYRGHAGKLFKRDFAGEILEAYPDLSLVDYGFVYHRDPLFPLDDTNWFLMEKH